MDRRIGVCSWSLRAETPQALVDLVRRCGLDAVQLALGPMIDGAWDEAGTRSALDTSGIAVLSGMLDMVGEDYSTLESIARTGGVKPDETWDANRRRVERAADLASRLGLGLVTTHAGFLPADKEDPVRVRMVDRLRWIADAFGAHGVRVGLETGQEPARDMLGVVEELGRDTIGINFDPANVLLYGVGEPIESFETLAPWVVQAHLKDAKPSGADGEWGEETPIGQGDVDFARLFERIDAVAPGIDLVIEREAGGERIEDVRAGAELARASRGSA